jgi:hypothetical protein
MMPARGDDRMPAHGEEEILHLVRQFTEHFGGTLNIVIKRAPELRQAILDEAERGFAEVLRRLREDGGVKGG